MGAHMYVCMCVSYIGTCVHRHRDTLCAYNHLCICVRVYTGTHTVCKARNKSGLKQPIKDKWIGKNLGGMRIFAC